MCVAVYFWRENGGKEFASKLPLPRAGIEWALVRKRGLKTSSHPQCRLFIQLSFTRWTFVACLRNVLRPVVINSGGQVVCFSRFILWMCSPASPWERLLCWCCACDLNTAFDHRRWFEWPIRVREGSRYETHVVRSVDCLIGRAFLNTFSAKCFHSIFQPIIFRSCQK